MQSRVSAERASDIKTEKYRRQRKRHRSRDIAGSERQLPAFGQQCEIERESRESGEAAEKAYVAQLSIPIPLWYRRQGEIAAALGAKERAEAEQTRTQNELATAITEQAQEARTARQQIEMFETGLLKQAEEALRIARVSYQQGAASLFEVIDAQRVHRQMLLEYAQARAAFSIAQARLERWAGGLP